MARLSLDNAAGPHVAADRWTAYSLTVWAICMLGFAFDIYEGTIMQLVTPILIKEWGIVPATMGYITTLSAWVGLIGVFIFPALADLYGRRPILILTILGYSLFTVPPTSSLAALCMSTTPRCRYWRRAPARPRPAGCGPMCIS